MTATEILRAEVKKYIDLADENSLRRVQAILEIDQSKNWWDDVSFVNEMEARYEAVENGSDKGVTLEELNAAFDSERKRRYGK